MRIIFRRCFFPAVLLFLISSISCAEDFSLSIAKIKFMLENSGNYKKALELVIPLLENSNLSNNQKSEAIYYYVLCSVKIDNEENLGKYINEIKQHKNIWSDKTLEIYNNYVSNQNLTDNTKEHIYNLSLDEIEKIKKNGGSLKEYLEIIKLNIDFELYLSILSDKIDIKKLRDMLKNFQISVETAINLIKKNIDIENYIFLTKSKKISDVEFWVLADNTEDINFITALYKAGFTKEKFYQLKQNNIDIDFFIKSIQNGFSEQDFYNFKIKNVSKKDLEYYNYFIEKGHNKNDFSIARIFGREGYERFLKYIDNRNKIYANITITAVLSVLSVGMLSASAVAAYFENDYLALVYKLENDYYKSTDSREKYHILQIQIPQAEKYKNMAQLSRIFLLSFGAFVGSFIIIPSVFLGIYVSRNIKMMNIFSDMGFYFDYKYAGVYFSYLF